jgi:predicted ester cyclase
MKRWNWILFFTASVATLNAFAATPTTHTPCKPGVQERNKAIARTVFEEILSQGRVDENEHLYHPTFVAHSPLRDAYRDEDRAASKGWRKAVPNLRMDVLRIVAECNVIVVHWSGSGTNSGEGNGLPATGKTLANMWGMTIFRIQDGQIREEWTSFDQYALLKQLGLLPN